MDAQAYEFWVAKVLLHTLSALAYCHSRAVIHKDLKPENVMMCSPRDAPVQDMHVVVVDFGLAEVFSHPTDRSAVVSGTPPYMAPEVWQGNFSKSCDIWSVGCMLFFLLSGRLPFQAPTLKEFPKAVQAEPDWSSFPGATQEARSMCRRMLNKRECLRDPWFVGTGVLAGSPAARALDQGGELLKSIPPGGPRGGTAMGTSPSGALPEGVQVGAGWERLGVLGSASRPLRVPLVGPPGVAAVGGRSEFEKFVTRLVATQLDAGQQRSANEAFRAFDTDGDGLLSREELRRGLAGLAASPEALEKVVNELDVGRTGQVSYTEFLAGVINLRGQTQEEQDKLLWVAWAQFCPDESGRVKAASIQDALATRGMTVADLPDGFLAALRKESDGTLSFELFKELLLSDSSGEVVRTLADEKQRGGKLFRWVMRRLDRDAAT
ncbi:unnamed protein product [Prorocentrum cordatum]|uniref:Non-specific serine/threonine protein kinase n=1 Tax=Prorocentrum cordatum TaxID=2364126 RepID=A0ABN9PRC3_9DINO|nr:unnamed protein product [Polarella glacialis]